MLVLVFFLARRSSVFDQRKRALDDVSAHAKFYDFFLTDIWLEKR